MSHFSWVISYDVIVDPSLLEQQKLNEFFLNWRKIKNLTRFKNMVIRTGSTIGPLRKSGPVRFCNVRFGPEMPSEKSNRKNEFQRGCVSYEGVFWLAESQPDSTFRQPISNEIIESRILIGPSKNNLLQ